jgi:hypothetical protein
MKTDTIKPPAEAAEGTLFLGDDWFDPLEAGLRTRIRGFIEELLEAELDAMLGRDRYERPRLVETGAGGRPVVKAGHRHGHRERQLFGSFGPVTARRAARPFGNTGRQDGRVEEQDHLGAQQPAGRAAWVGCTASANNTASLST